MDIGRRQFLGLFSTASIAAGLRLWEDRRLQVEDSPGKKIARERGMEYLARAQGEDGAWRSSHYGIFRKGDVLTPLVMVALSGRRGNAMADDALERGRGWLDDLTGRVSNLEAPWSELQYPLFSASYATQFYASIGDTERACVWANCVEALQLRPDLGWDAGDARCGGWSDAPSPPRVCLGMEHVPDMMNPNLSATVFAVSALAAVGRIERAREAARFVKSCRNVDGGFFFALDDAVRNKAGRIERADGSFVYRSYGSATCDALGCLLAMGEPIEGEVVSSGFHWLQRHAENAVHPGDWAAERADSGRALVFYYGQALARLARQSGIANQLKEPLRRLTQEFARRQAEDGSWSNPDAESCEDDPLLATALAVQAF